MTARSPEIRIAVIGLGYVGLPLALALAEKYDTIGFDVNRHRIGSLQEGHDLTAQVDEEGLKSSNLQYVSDLSGIRECNVYIITVPTPVDKNKKPDLHALISASKGVGSVLKAGDIVIFESTVYPGCTEEDCVPVLEQESGLRYNTDFFCGYSPERISPGDDLHTLKNVVKVTSGSNAETAEFVNQLYSSIITAGTHKAPSIKTAEASKAIENAQRDLNISFVNELALIFDKMDIDTTEVLEAASTKWNFLKFKPGLVGGHCIGVDPYYLAHKAESLGYHPRVILSGRHVNDFMSRFVVNKSFKLLSQRNVTLPGARALILGVTFKENCPDTRNSKVFDIITDLEQVGMLVDIFDPIADSREHPSPSVNYIEDVYQHPYQLIILAVAHTGFLDLDYRRMKGEQTVLFDTRAVLDRSVVDCRL